MIRTSMALAGASLLVAGCTPADVRFGEATSWNKAQQIINPDPNYEGEVMEGGSGERAAAAVQRYETGTVTQPVVVNTTSTGSSGSSGPR
jgi:hypothetical protein